MSGSVDHTLIPLPVSVMTQSAWLRLGVAAAALVVLWLAVIWATALP